MPGQMVCGMQAKIIFWDKRMEKAAEIRYVRKMNLILYSLFLLASNGFSKRSLKVCKIFLEKKLVAAG